MTHNTRYNNGKIYKIINNFNDMVYIGSTCLPLRMAEARLAETGLTSERLGPRLTAMFESADGLLFIEAHSRFSSVLDRFSVFSIRWNSDALVSLV